ncbi:MAG: DUF2723 domain-containing protein [Anaerolineae bacterium]|nr:DUF2723 domain-containing protein [Anaerolineae bacterium]
MLGIPHPPGFPTYMLISHLFSRLPLGTLGYRINLMSAFLGSLTIAVLYLIILRVINVPSLAILGSLIFAFSRTFWSQCVVAEVYTLNAFFIAAVILSLFIWEEKRETKYLYLSCFIYAISFGNHLMVAALLPAFIYFVLATDYRVLLNAKHLLTILACIALGALQYLYLFIRSYQNAPFLYTNIRTLQHFFFFITLAQHRTKIFDVTLAELVKLRLPLFLILLSYQFSPLGLFMGPVGFYRLVKEWAKYAVFFLMLMMVVVFVSLCYKGSETYAYLIPFHLVLSIGLSIAFKWLTTISTNYLRSGSVLLKRLSKGLLLGLFGVYVCLIFLVNYPIVDQSNSTFYDAFTRAVIENVESHSLILSPGWDWTGYYLYHLLGEERRPNDDIWIVHHWSSEALKGYLAGEDLPDNPLPSRPPKYIRNIYFQDREDEILEAGFQWQEVDLGGVKLVQFHKINLNMLFGPWTDSLPVVGDRVKKRAQVSYLHGF